MKPEQREIPDLIDYESFPTDANPSMLFVPDVPERMPIIAYILLLGSLAAGFLAALATSYVFAPRLGALAYRVAAFGLFIAQLLCLYLSRQILRHYAFRLASNPDISFDRARVVRDVARRWADTARSTGTMFEALWGPFVLAILAGLACEIRGLPHAVMAKLVLSYLAVSGLLLWSTSTSLPSFLSHATMESLEHCFAWKLRSILPHYALMFRYWFQRDYARIPNGARPAIGYHLRLFHVVLTVFLLTFSLCWLSCFFCLVPTLPSDSNDYWLTAVDGPEDVSEDALAIFNAVANGDESRNDELEGEVWDDFLRLYDHRSNVLLLPSGWMTTVSVENSAHSVAVLWGFAKSLLLVATVIPITFVVFVFVPMTQPFAVVVQVGEPTLSDATRWKNTVSRIYHSDCPYESESIYLGDYDGPEYATITLERLGAR